MIKNNKRKGLSSIQTMSGRTTGERVLYMDYFAMGVLAMEKSRRESERASAQSRIDGIDERLIEIDVSMNQLSGQGVESVIDARAKVPILKKKSAKRPDSGDFRFKY